MHAHDQSMVHARDQSVGRSLVSCIGENGTHNHLPHAKVFGKNLDFHRDVVSIDMISVGSLHSPIIRPPSIYKHISFHVQHEIVLNEILNDTQDR